MSPNTYLQLGHNKILHLILALFFGSQKSTMSYGRLCPHFHHLLGNSKISDFYLSFFFSYCQKKHYELSEAMPKIFIIYQDTAKFFILFVIFVCPNFHCLSGHSIIPHFRQVILLAKKHHRLLKAILLPPFFPGYDTSV